MFTYRITSCLAIGDINSLILTAFPSWDGEPISASQSEIIVTFNTEQTPVNLGPLVKIELISEE